MVVTAFFILIQYPKCNTDISYDKQFSWKLKQGEISEEEYDNWRYNYPNIEPTTGFVKNAISNDLDAELQDALSEEMKKRGLL